MLKLKRPLLRVSAVCGRLVGVRWGLVPGRGWAWARCGHQPGAGHGYVIPSPAPPASRGKERFVFKKPTNNVCFRFHNWIIKQWYYSIAHCVDSEQWKQDGDHFVHLWTNPSDNRWKGIFFILFLMSERTIPFKSKVLLIFVLLCLGYVLPCLHILSFLYLI